jgi:hypothetical protein
VQRVVKGIEPISPNLFTTAAEFPLITEGVLRRYNMEQRESDLVPNGTRFGVLRRYNMEQREG